MARTVDIQHSFVTGEISPYLLGRTDLAKYANSCESLVNFVVKVQGGVIRRPGMRFINNESGPGRLIPFIFSAEESFMLYFSDQYISIYKDDALFGQPIGSPYRYADDFKLIKYAQIGDIMYLVHPKYPVQRLNRLSDSSWIITQPSFSTAPATKTDQDVSGGSIDINSFGEAGPTFIGIGTASVPSDGVVWFTSSNIGQHITTADGGDAVITGLSGSPYVVPTYPTYITVYPAVTIDILNGFTSSTYAVWDIAGVPINTSTLTISGNQSVGATLVTFSDYVIMKGDIGKKIIAGTGQAVIMDVAGSGHEDPTTHAILFNAASVVVIDPFNRTQGLPVYSAGEWFLRGGSNSWLCSGQLEERVVGGNTIKYWHGSQQFGEGIAVEVRTLSLHPTDISFEQVDASGTKYEHIFYEGEPVHTFRKIDEGRYVAFSGGYALCMVVSNSTTATFIIKSVPTQSEPNAQGELLIAPSPPGAWYFEDIAYSTDKGFIHDVCFFQDRLWLAATEDNAQTIWASGVGDYENFAKGTLDDAGIEIDVASGSFDSVLWIHPYQGNIVIGTFRGEFVLSGSGLSTLGQNTAAITPSNATITFQSAYGVTSIQPQIIQEVLFYVQRSQQNVYQMEFNIQNALYTSKDLNVLNNLITETPIIEMTYQENPNKVVWFITADTELDENGLQTGKGLIGLTYDRVQDVFAWHRHTTGFLGQDSFLSICSIPVVVDNAVKDEVWIATKRTVGEDTLYSIEVFDSSVNTDWADIKVYNSPVSEITITALKGVLQIVADDAILPIVTVTEWPTTYTFPLGYTASKVEVGIPFTSYLKTVRPEMSGGGKSTIQGLIKRWVKVWARIYKSYGLTINGQFVPTMTTHMVTVGRPADMVTGDISITNLGYDRDGRIEIVQSYPAAANVLCIFGQITIGEN